MNGETLSPGASHLPVLTVSRPPPSRLWTRRGFLRAALVGATTLLFAACRLRRRPTPTPTPTKTPTLAVPYQQRLPAVMHRSASTPTSRTPETSPPASSVPPTPSPRPAPRPTPTPVPTPTPFPPGPPSKLGLFVGYNHPQLFDLLRTGNVALVKTLEYDPNFVAEIKQVSPDTLVVARYTPLDPPDWGRVNPRALARRFADLILPIATHPKRRAHIDAWEAYNEPLVVNRAQMARLADFEAERARLLAVEGIRSCVGNFSTGHPDLALWPAFFPALHAIREHSGYLGLHEYSAPYMWFGTGPFQLRAGSDEGDEGWLTLRYRKVYRQHLQPAGLEVPLLITETGIDGGIRNRPGPPGQGWRDFQDFWRREGHVTTTAAGFYVEQLAWYDAQLVQDPYVKGAAIYALAAPRGWASFEILGQCAAILQQYLAVHPPR